MIQSPIGKILNTGRIFLKNCSYRRKIITVIAITNTNNAINLLGDKKLKYRDANLSNVSNSQKNNQKALITSKAPSTLLHANFNPINKRTLITANIPAKIST